MLSHVYIVLLVRYALLCCAQEDAEKRGQTREVNAVELLKLPGLRSSYSRSRIGLSPTRPKSHAISHMESTGVAHSGIDEISSDIVAVAKGSKKISRKFPGSAQYKPSPGSVNLTTYVSAVTKQRELEVGSRIWCMLLCVIG